MLTALIDGDVLCYRIGFSLEKDLEISPYRDIAEQATSSYIQKLLQEVGTDYYKVYLTDTNPESNFRTSISTLEMYKGNRKGVKPVHYNNIREYLLGLDVTEEVSGYEADDAMGMAQTDNTVIVTIDKDLLMIPGKHMRMDTYQKILSSDPGKLVKKSYSNGRVKVIGVGFKWFCCQMLMGDRVDNILGLPGVGQSKAYEYLKDANTVAEMWKVVFDLYEQKDMLDYLDEMARLLWIWRADFGRDYLTFIEEHL